MGTRYIVRYGATRNVAEFSTKGPAEYVRDSAVIVRSDRGVEWGQVLCQANAATRDYLGVKNGKGRILRAASETDHRKLDDVRRAEVREFEGCGEMIRQRKLQMQLVDVEHLFGGERVIFYYLAEKRVDFRELVKALAKRYRTRIEMRQIGVRDEAKLLADCGDCGKPCCCKCHLCEMPPVSMKMAKVQKATLDPAKISGRCGRLKCCLRYEYDTYEEYRRSLPSLGNSVVTSQGEGKVIGQEILARRVLVEHDDGRHMLTDERDILTVVKKSGGRKGRRGDKNNSNSED